MADLSISVEGGKVVSRDDKGGVVREVDMPARPESRDDKRIDDDLALIEARLAGISGGMVRELLIRAKAILTEWRKVGNG